jgi:hypothetical protein
MEMNASLLEGPVVILFIFVWDFPLAPFSLVLLHDAPFLQDNPKRKVVE